MKNNQSGRSMVEMLGVLAIIGVLSAGGLAGYSKAMFKHKLNSSMDQLTMLITNIRTMYGTQESYEGLNNRSAIALGIVPSQMIGNPIEAVVAGETVIGKDAENHDIIAGEDDAHDASTQLVNPFKGDVTISVSQARSGVENSAFIVKYDGLPKEACVTIATSDWGTGAGSGFIASEVNGKTGTAINGKPIDAIKTAYAGEDYEGSPMSVQSALTNCDGDENYVTLKFY